MSQHGTLWVRCRSMFISQDKERILFTNLLDVQKQTELMLENEFLLSHVPGDLIYIKQGQLTFYTNNITKTLGYTELEYQRLIEKTKGLFFVDVEDREYVYKTVKPAIDEQRELDISFRMNTKHGKKRYMRFRLIKTNGFNKEIQLYGVLMETTRIVRFQQAISIANQRVQYLLEHVDFDGFEYDYETDQMHIYTQADLSQEDVFSCMHKNAHACVIDHFMEKIRYMGDFSSEAYEVLSLLEKKIHTNDLSSTTIDLSKYHSGPLLVRIECEVIYNEEHTLIRMLGLMKNITRTLAS